MLYKSKHVRAWDSHERQALADRKEGMRRVHFGRGSWHDAFYKMAINQWQ